MHLYLGIYKELQIKKKNAQNPIFLNWRFTKEEDIQIAIEYTKTLLLRIY